MTTRITYETNARAHYEAMIDGIDFGTIARYLQHPASPIHCLLHLKDRSMLAPVAAVLERELEAGAFYNGLVPETISNLIKDGLLKVSMREDDGPKVPHYISAKSVNPAARCEVIYLEPFYLVHTPGLFEREHQREPCSTQPQADQSARQKAIDSLNELMSAEEKRPEQEHPEQAKDKRITHSH
jgi:hypothetical protein